MPAKAGWPYCSPAAAIYSGISIIQISHYCQYIRTRSSSGRQSCHKFFCTLSLTAMPTPIVIPAQAGINSPQGGEYCGDKAAFDRRGFYIPVILATALAEGHRNQIAAPIIAQAFPRSGDLVGFRPRMRKTSLRKARWQNAVFVNSWTAESAH